MIVGSPREIKNHEYRVGLTPAGVRTLVAAGHDVLIERDAGLRVGFPDADYSAAGARIVGDAAQIYGDAELVVKIKELQASEYALARPGRQPPVLQELLQARAVFLRVGRTRIGDVGEDLRREAGNLVEEDALTDEFGISSGFANYTSAAIDITDNTHYITSPSPNIL